MPVMFDRTSDTPWATAVLICTLLLAALFIYALFVPPAVNSRGMPHAEYSSMLQGASGIERHGSILWLGWAIGAAEILLCFALVALGARRGADSDRSAGSLNGLGGPLVACLIAVLGVWTLLMVTYARYLHDPSPDLILALPAPTAVMLYLLWPVPLVLAGFYVVGFRRWVFSERDEESFRLLVERRRARHQRADREAE